jgi:hypothetical protein
VADHDRGAFLALQLGVDGDERVGRGGRGRGDQDGGGGGKRGDPATDRPAPAFVTVLDSA